MKNGICDGCGDKCRVDVGDVNGGHQDWMLCEQCAEWFGEHRTKLPPWAGE